MPVRLHCRDLVLLTTTLLLTAGCAKRPSQFPEALETVAQVDSVHCTISKSDPPELTVNAFGQVGRGGWTGPTLTPRVYVTPPADGIWDYDLEAIPPSGPSTAVMTPIEAKHLWPNYPATSLKGVRVHGAGSGIKEATLEQCLQS